MQYECILDAEKEKAASSEGGCDQVEQECFLMILRWYVDMSDLITTWLQDEESQFIFKKRIEFNESNNYRLFREIIDKYVPELSNSYYYPGKEKEIIEKVKEKTHIWIRGGGIRCRRIIDMLQNADINIEGVIDRNDEIEDIMGIPVFHWNKVNITEIDCLIISMTDREVAEECAKEAVLLGVSKKDIIMHREYCLMVLENKQYFEKFIKYTEGETFIDAGVLDLATSIRFAEQCIKNHVIDFKIYAFEPDKKSYERCMNIKAQYPEMKIELINSGLWSSNTVIGFDLLGNGASGINEESSDVIKCVTLDSSVKEKVTFIKMDIEGAELEALKGCQNIIRNYKPKLAISVYHKAEDIIEIPHYIKQLVPEYRLYLRHYSNGHTETILYALP